MPQRSYLLPCYLAVGYGDDVPVEGLYLGSSESDYPASLYLVLSDRFAWGIFLFLYGALVVGLTDNFLRPLVIDKSVKLHPAVIFVGVVSGIFVYVVIGIFLGPLVLRLLQSSMIIFRDYYSKL